MSLMKREASRMWDPFRELEDMSSRLNRLFGRSLVSQENLTGFDWTPSIDVSETPTSYLIKAELPGVKKEDVHVDIDAGVLSITGERKQQQEHKDEKYHRVESSYGSFMRRFTVPEDANTEGVEAAFNDGVLMVKLGKKPAPEKPKAKRIPVA